MSETDRMKVLYDCFKILLSKQDIPFALRNLANANNINIQQLEDIIKDVNKKDELTDGESWEAGIPDPEDEDFRDSDYYPGGLSLLYGDD